MKQMRKQQFLQKVSFFKIYFLMHEYQAVIRDKTGQAQCSLTKILDIAFVASSSSD
jgi:hypothetical protein